MARERWFYAPTHKRLGPMPLTQLVEGLLRLPDPRSCLVWKFGLPSWTPAGDVADVDRHLAPFVPARRPPAPVEAPPRVAPGTVPSGAAAPRARTAARATAAGPSPLVYGAAGAGVLVLGLVVWLFWPKAPAPRPKAGGSASPADFITLKEGNPGSGPAGGGTTGTPGATPGQAGFAGWSDQETSLPPSEIAKLKAVAGWSGRSLEMTIYNGGAWRITELQVRVRRMANENWVDDERPLILLPVGARVEQQVDKVMDRVAGVRYKPGVSPLDTGKFAAEAGERPQPFGASIVGARGYAPR
jgi:hypothetical protein